MDLKSAVDIILKDLKEARDLIGDLRNKPELPELQIELAKSKCRSAEELIRLIGEIISEARHDNNIDPGKEMSAMPTETDRQADLIDNDILDLEEELEEAEINETEIAEPASPEMEEEILYPEKEPEEKVEPAEIRKGDKIVADKFAHLASRINEKVGDSKKTGGKTRSLPVTDLNKAIGINDRFYFIRELFDGREDSFRETINKLNNAATREEASAILDDTVKEMADSEPAHQLLELVERKLSVK
ncbi:MAG: hypothetical protein RQ743_09010 [Bacteroidales bacterium]|nr:hypothetical protein [Bacteroidales bacterium]